MTAAASLKVWQCLVPRSIHLHQPSLTLHADKHCMCRLRSTCEPAVCGGRSCARVASPTTPPPPLATSSQAVRTPSWAWTTPAGRSAGPRCADSAACLLQLPDFCVQGLSRLSAATVRLLCARPQQPDSLMQGFAHLRVCSACPALLPRLSDSHTERALCTQMSHLLCWP